MADALALNGVPFTKIRVEYLVDPPLWMPPGTAKSAEPFLVKGWTFGEPSYPGAEYPYFFEMAGNIMDMVPRPQNGNYGDLTSLSANSGGAAGQNSDPPSQQVFIAHFLLKYQGNNITVYYDPSYGKTYLSNTDFQLSAVAGFGKEVAAASYGHWRMHVRPPGVTTEITFTQE